MTALSVVVAVAVSALAAVAHGPSSAAECAAEAEAALREVYEHALNAGDVEAATSRFAPDGEFKWYSEPPDRHDVNRIWDPYERASLDDYLASTLEDGTVWTIIDVRSQHSTLVVNFYGTMRRTTGSTDYEAMFKGAFNCPNGVFFVMSIGDWRDVGTVPMKLRHDGMVPDAW